MRDRTPDLCHGAILPAVRHRDPVRRYYSRQAAVYDRTRRFVLPGRRRAVEALRIRPDGRVLEVGCGTGWNLAGIAARLDPQRGSITGVDFSAEMLRRARASLRGRGNAHLVLCDSAQLAISGRFDAALFSYSLSLIPDAASALRSAVDLLDSGGRLVVLDFADFGGWGPVAPLIRLWLRRHRVQWNRPYGEWLRALLPGVEIRTYLRGYYFLAAGRTPATSA